MAEELTLLLEISRSALDISSNHHSTINAPQLCARSLPLLPSLRWAASDASHAAMKQFSTAHVRELHQQLLSEPTPPTQSLLYKISIFSRTGSRFPCVSFSIAPDACCDYVFRIVFPAILLGFKVFSGTFEQFCLGQAKFVRLSI